MEKTLSVSNLDIPLDRDIFLRTLIRELAGVLEEVVGYDEAAGYVSLVGQNIGEWINNQFRKEMGVSSLSREQVANTLVDLKARIQGDFSITYQDDTRIVLENRTCPFEDKVIDRPSMCMMTSNVFGCIAAENLGYAKVVIEQAIARRDDRCKVIVYLTSSSESKAAEGREYFRAENNDN
jgi:predicted ArsR family transcriptional regulator